LTDDLSPLASYAEVPGEDLLQAKYLLAAIRVHNVRRNDAWAPSNRVGQRQPEAPDPPPAFHERQLLRLLAIRKVAGFAPS